MGLMESGVRAASKRMPKVFSPRAHAAIDYAVAGSFFVAGALLWRKHRKASVASIACGVAQAATAAITDYPGGIRPIISFRTHERIEAGLASVVGAMPLAMNFGDDAEARWFRAHGIAIAAITGLTDYEDDNALDWRRAA